jgi:hypothetical protein
MQISNIIPTGWWLLFQNWDFYRIEDLDLHNLAAKKASSLLLISLDYFYQITCKFIPVVLLLHLKAKGSLFIIIWLVVIDPSGDNLGRLAGGTMVRLSWWRFHLHGKVNPRSNNQCRSYSCAVKTVSSKRLGMGRESHLYLLSFACQRTLSYRSPYVLREYVHMGGTP